MSSFQNEGHDWKVGGSETSSKTVRQYIIVLKIVIYANNI